MTTKLTFESLAQMLVRDGVQVVESELNRILVDDHNIGPATVVTVMGAVVVETVYGPTQLDFLSAIVSDYSTESASVSSRIEAAPQNDDWAFQDVFDEPWVFVGREIEAKFWYNAQIALIKEVVDDIASYKIAKDAVLDGIRNNPYTV